MDAIDMSQSASTSDDDRIGDLPDTASHAERLLDLALKNEVDQFKALFETTPSADSLSQLLPVADGQLARYDMTSKLRDCGIWEPPPEMRIIDVACYLKHESIVLYLLQKGADPSTPDTRGTTLFHIAARVGAVRVLADLLGWRDPEGHGLKIDALEEHSPSAKLSYHARIREESYICPCWACISGRQGSTALELAAARDHVEVVDSLMNNGANVGLACFVALWEANFDVALLLLERDFSGELSDRQGNTLLHAAARSEHRLDSDEESFRDKERKLFRIVKLVIELAGSLDHDPDPRQRHVYKKTAWDIAFETSVLFKVGRIVVLSALAQQQAGMFQWRLFETDRSGHFGQFGRSYSTTLTAPWPVLTEAAIEQQPHALSPTMFRVCTVLTNNGVASELLDGLGKKDDDMPQSLKFDAIRFIDSQIKVDSETLTRDGWIAREPGSTFRRLSYLAGQSKVAEVELSAVAIPFLWVCEEKELKRLRAKSAAPLRNEWCSTSDRRTLRKCQPLTLDEYMNSGLGRSIMRGRNRNQILRRYSSKVDLNGDRYVITVVQAWAFNILGNFIISFPEITSLELFSPMWDMMYSDMRQPIVPREGVIPDVISLAVESLDSSGAGEYAGYPESIFTVFAKEITALSLAVKNHTNKKSIKGDDMEEERGFLHKINDIREELSMIRRVISQQEDVWRDFVSHTWPQVENWPDGYGGAFRPVRIFGPNHEAGGVGGQHLSAEVNLLKDKIARLEAIVQQRDDLPQSADQSEHRPNDSYLSLNGSHRESGSSGASSYSLSRQVWDSTSASQLADSIAKPQYLIAKYKRKIAELEEDAERVERSIQLSLDLRQKHIALRETHSMSVMSASVFAFTVITIIFTPLSFTTSLFALPVDRFASQQTGEGDDSVYPASYIGKWLTTVELSSLVLTGVTIVVALKFFLEINIREDIVTPAVERFQEHWAPKKTSDGDQEPDGSESDEGFVDDWSDDENKPNTGQPAAAPAPAPTDENRGGPLLARLQGLPGRLSLFQRSKKQSVNSPVLGELGGDIQLENLGRPNGNAADSIV